MWRRNSVPFTSIGIRLLCALVGLLGTAASLPAQNALVVEADRVATASDLASGGKLQLGDLTLGSASCIAVDSDRPFADLDCDGTKETGEEYLDGGGGGGGGSDPLAEQYHPDRPPVSCDTGGGCEEFTSGSESLTWRWGNQGEASLALAMDAAVLSGDDDSGNNLRGRWKDAPAATDFVSSARLVVDYGTNGHDGGLWALVEGSEASPTRIYTCLVDRTSSNVQVAYQRMSSYSAWHSNVAIVGASNSDFRVDTGVYLQWRWDDTEETLACYYSFDGFLWNLVSSVDLTSAGLAPISLGYWANSTNAGSVPRVLVPWLRTRTDTAGLTGETGG